MTITQANDINTVLENLMLLRQFTGIRDNQDAVAAATIRLADHSHKTLGAGITGDAIRRAWPKPAGWTGKETR